MFCPASASLKVCWPPRHLALTDRSPPCSSTLILIQTHWASPKPEQIPGRPINHYPKSYCQSRLFVGFLLLELAHPTIGIWRGAESTFLLEFFPFLLVPTCSIRAYTLPSQGDHRLSSLTPLVKLEEFGGNPDAPFSTLLLVSAAQWMASKLGPLESGRCSHQWFAASAPSTFTTKCI